MSFSAFFKKSDLSLMFLPKKKKIEKKLFHDQEAGCKGIPYSLMPEEAQAKKVEVWALKAFLDLADPCYTGHVGFNIQFEY